MQIKDWWNFLRGANLSMIALIIWLTHHQLIAFDTVSTSSPIALFWLICCTLFISAGGNLLNDFFDRDMDFINKPHRTYVGTKLSLPASLLSYGISLLGAFVSFLAYIFVAGYQTWMLIFPLTACLLFLYAYRFKRTVLFGNLIISLLAGLVPMLAYWNSRGLDMHNPLEEPVVLLGIIAFTTTLLREVIKDKEDLVGDKAVGAKTLAMWLGYKELAISLTLLIFTIPFLTWYFYTKLDLNPVRIGLIELAVLACAGMVMKYIWQSQPNWKKASLWSKILMLSGLLGLLLRF